MEIIERISGTDVITASNTTILYLVLKTNYSASTFEINLIIQ